MLRLYVHCLLVVHTVHSCVTLLGDVLLPVQWVVFEVCVLFIVLYNECVQNRGLGDILINVSKI